LPQKVSLVERLSTTPLNQARSMMLAGLAVAPEDVSESDREAHVQVMKMVIPSLFLRGPLAVLAAIAVSFIAGLIGLPSSFSDAVAWTLVFALPCVAIALWFALLLWRLGRASIHEVLTPERGHVPLMYVSALGYAAAAAVGVIGPIFRPDLFP
jgi:hypothetical protein